MNVDNAYRILFMAALIWFSFLLLITLIRAIIGPRVTDRILSINMICTMVIACTCILAYLLNESYLFDVALLYAMLSFITVLILSATYIPKNPTRRKFIDKMKAQVSPAGAAGAEKETGQTVFAEQAAESGGSESVKTDGGNESVKTDGGKESVKTDGGKEPVRESGGKESVRADGGKEGVEK